MKIKAWNVILKFTTHDKKTLRSKIVIILCSLITGLIKIHCTITFTPYRDDSHQWKADLVTALNIYRRMFCLRIVRDVCEICMNNLGTIYMHTQRNK
jgi:hypothetical protein